jgi:hypothetical protein
MLYSGGRWLDSFRNKRSKLQVWDLAEGDPLRESREDKVAAMVWDHKVSVLLCQDFDKGII